MNWQNLEFAAQNQGADDLYLLQQLAGAIGKRPPGIYYVYYTSHLQSIAKD